MTMETNMTSKTDESCLPGENCPVTRAVRALDGKWKLHIVFHLLDGTKRFSELRRAIPGVTQQMLTSQLRELEASGIVDRRVYAQVPPKVEYSLTPLGAGLRAVTDALGSWGRNLPEDRRPTD
ncbi:winged helix-turn-helix transcriptional regulator [Tistrella mobilis]